MPAGIRSIVARSDPREALPLSFAQEGLWIAQERDPANAAYNSVRYFALDGACDCRALVNSLREVVRRHEILRTGISIIDGTPMRRIHDGETLEIPRVDLQALPPCVRERRAERLARALARRPFQLDHEPCLRLVLLRLRPDAHVLLIVSHHLIADGHSMTIFLGELASAYEAAVAARPWPWCDAPLQFGDFVAWQRARCGDALLQAQTDFWRRTLMNAPPLCTFPSTRARAAQQGGHGQRLRVVVPAELDTAVRRLASAQAATPFMVWMTVSMALLFRLSGQPDVVMGLNLTDRRRPELRRVLGFFIATLPVRVRFDGDRTFAGALRAVRDAILDAQARQDVSLTRLVDALRPTRVAGAHPLFQVVATGQEVADVATGWSTPRLTSREIDTGMTRFDQFLSYEQRPDRLEVVVVFDANLYDRPAIERQVTHLFRLAEAATRQPDCPVLDLPIDTGDQPPHRPHLASLNTAAQFVFES